MSNNYPPGCCKKLISKYKGHFDFQKAELCFPFESTPRRQKKSVFFNDRPEDFYREQSF